MTPAAADARAVARRVDYPDLVTFSIGPTGAVDALQHAGRRLGRHR
ncbi:MAG: hypothetical protein ACKVZ0_17510 [Gemmatimonadales bacterium]